MPDAATVTPQAIWSARLIRLINDQDGKPTAPDVIELAEMDPESVEDEVDAEADAAEVEEVRQVQPLEADLWHEDDTEAEPGELPNGDDGALTVDEVATLTALYRKAIEAEARKHRAKKSPPTGSSADQGAQPTDSDPLALLWTNDSNVTDVRFPVGNSWVKSGVDLHWPSYHAPFLAGLTGFQVLGLSDDPLVGSQLARINNVGIRVISSSGPSETKVEDLDEIPLDVLEAAVKRVKAKTRERIKRR